MKFLVLLNGRAGALAGTEPAAVEQRIVRGFARAGAAAEVHLVEAAQLDRVARDVAHAGDADAIIAGGGDGTLNTVANALLGSGKAFGVLPLGTLNHFAKELAIPLDLDDAVTTLARGRVEEIPVAEVNGRAFLNFSAIGIHPHAVEARDRATLARRVLSRTMTMVLALLRVLSRPPVYTVRITSPTDQFDRRTPSVIVCNNPYQMRAFGVEAASVANRGLLNVYVADSHRPYNVIRLLVRAMLRRLRREARHFTAVALPEFDVDARWVRTIRVSVDGEVTTMRLPLHYRIHPTALRVLMPAEPAEPARAAHGSSVNTARDVWGSNGTDR